MRAEVLLETLRERRRSLLWWGVGIAALVALVIAFYPSVRDSTDLTAYAKDLPKSLRGLFAGGEIDIASAAGYLNSQVFALMAPIVLIIFTVGFGAGAIAGEEERGTLDLMLSHPLRRPDYALQQFLALAILVAALTLVLLATTAVGARIVDLEIGFDKLVAGSVSVGLLALLFGAVALAVGGLRPGRAIAIAVAAAIATASWLLDGLGAAVDLLEPLRPISPFYQAIGRAPLTEGAPWIGWGILLAATVALVALAAAGLARRDVRQG